MDGKKEKKRRNKKSCRSLENDCHRGNSGGGKGVIRQEEVRKERWEVGDWKVSKDIENCDSIDPGVQFFSA